MQFLVPDYKLVNKRLRAHKSQFSNDQELNQYVNKHPEILLNSFSKPLSINKAILMSLQLLVPGLREDKHVVSYCNVIHVHDLKFTFNIYYANKRSLRYWYLLDQELTHTHIVPIWTLKKHWFRKDKLIVIKFYFWRVWHKLAQKNVIFNYINDLQQLRLRKPQILYAEPQATKRQPHKIVLRKYFYRHQIRIIKPLQPINTNEYQIGQHKYIIQSKPLERRLKYGK